MVIDFRVIWAADINNVNRFYDRGPARRPKVTRRPPPRRHTKILKKTADISLLVPILGLFGPLISIVALDNSFAASPAGQGPANRLHTKIKNTTCILLLVSILGLFGPLISIVAFDNRFAASPAGQGPPADRLHTKI